MTIAERGRYAGCSEEQNDPRDISNSDRRDVTSKDPKAPEVQDGLLYWFCVVGRVHGRVCDWPPFQ